MRTFLLAPFLLAAATVRADYDYGDSTEDDVVWVTSTVQVYKTMQMDQCCQYSGTTLYGQMRVVSTAQAGAIAGNATATAISASVVSVSVSPTSISNSSSVSNSTSSDGSDGDDGGDCPIVGVGGDCTSSSVCCMSGTVCDGVTNTCLIDNEPNGVCNVGPGIEGADCSLYSDCCGDDISCNRQTGKCECSNLDGGCGNGQAGGSPLASGAPVAASPAATSAASAPSSIQSPTDDSCVGAVGGDCTNTGCCNGLVCDAFANTCLTDTDPKDDGSCTGPNTVGADCSKFIDCCDDADGNSLFCDRDVGTCSSD